VKKRPVLENAENFKNIMVEQDSVFPFVLRGCLIYGHKSD
jgi:hypothetical protein